MMTVMVWAACVAAVAVLVVVATRYTRLEFVKHAKLLWKAWSVWLASIGSALGVYLAAHPDDLVNTWNALPPELKELLPVNFAQYVTYFMIAVGVIARFIRQPDLTKEREKLEKSDDNA